MPDWALLVLLVAIVVGWFVVKSLIETGVDVGVNKAGELIGRSRKRRSAFLHVWWLCPSEVPASHLLARIQAITAGSGSGCSARIVLRKGTEAVEVGTYSSNYEELQGATLRAARSVDPRCQMRLD